MTKIEELPEEVAYIQGMVVALNAICHTPSSSNIMDEIIQSLNELREDTLALWNRKEQTNEQH